MALVRSLLSNLAAYFCINLLLSTLNKLVLDQIPTPWLLTCLHMLCTSTGCFVCLQGRVFKLTRDLSRRENLTLLSFSCLFTINIAMSNVSLSHVSLAFHQVARSTSPIFTVAIYGLWFRKVYRVPVYMAVTVTSMGIALATYGDFSCTTLGFWLTFLGMVLATIKTIATNQLMTGNLTLHPLEALLRMCPSAAAQSLLCAHFTGEFEIVRGLLSRSSLPTSTLKLVAANGLLAFGQNLSSFHTNQVAGALTIAVAANLKQLCTIVLAVRMFETKLTVLGAVGVITVLSGTTWYSWLITRRQKRDEESQLGPGSLSRSASGVKQ